MKNKAKTLKEINESIPVAPPIFHIPGKGFCTKREAWEWAREFHKNMTAKQKLAMLGKPSLN